MCADTQRLELSDVWPVLERIHASKIIVFLMKLSEEVQTPDIEERKAIAFAIETKLLWVPSLELYARVRMYDFIGVSTLSVDRLLAWFKGHSESRCGLVEAGNNGLRAAEILMTGTAEAAREHRDHYLFRMVNEWVVPA